MKNIIDIYEGILGDIEARVNNDSEDIKGIIWDFLNEFYKGDYMISDEPNKDGKYEVYGNSDISLNHMSKTKSLTNGIFIWAEINGDFYCRYNDIESLEGGPKKVYGDFICDGCYRLKSLEGSPEYVGKDFCCDYCHELIDLKGSPKYVGHEFSCKQCMHLKSLEGCTIKVVDFNCSECQMLLSLKGCPTNVTRDFDCSSCINLLHFDCKNTKVKNIFCCSGCYSLKDLNNAPKSVGSIVCRRVSQFTEDEWLSCSKIKSKKIFK